MGAEFCCSALFFIVKYLQQRSGKQHRVAFSSYDDQEKICTRLMVSVDPAPHKNKSEPILTIYRRSHIFVFKTEIKQATLRSAKRIKPVGLCFLVDESRRVVSVSYFRFKILQIMINRQKRTLQKKLFLVTSNIQFREKTVSENLN